ncbi:MAG TPA: V-type ATPase 116kDa subunit family protein, partial [Clostridium sp.]
MAIVKMNKFTLLAFESQKAKLLEELQSFSEVEFINLQDDEILEKNEDLIDLYKDDSGSQYAKCEEKLSMAKFALQFLKEYIPKKSGLKAMREGKKELTLKEIEDQVLESSWEETYDKVKEKEDRINSLENKITKLQIIIDTMTPWEKLDVSFEELSSMKAPHFLGSIPKQYEETLVFEITDCYIEIISSNNQDLFFLGICVEDKKEEVAEKLRELGFSQFKTELTDIPIKIIHDNMDNIDKIQSKKFFVCEALTALDEEHNLFELVYQYYDNMVIRKEAINNFLKTENVMIIQGWLPLNENEKFKNIIEETLGENFYFVFEDVKDEEISNVPIKLENNNLNSAFESITEMYSVPKYDEIDPTPLLTPFYLAFFGMMVSDVGYGLLLLFATLAVLKLFKLEEGT